MPNFEQNMPKKEKFIPVKTEYGFKPEKGPKWETGAETSASEDHPEKNEDSSFVDARGLAAGVFDGMSGRMGGDIASREAKDIIRRHFNALPIRATAEEIKKSLTDVMTEVHKKILDIAQRRPEFKEMATSASVGKIVEENGKRKLVFAHIGDSRIYVARADGSLKQVTVDDGLLGPAMEKAKKEGNREEISKLEKLLAEMDEVEDVSGKDVDADLRVYFPYRNIMKKGLGIENDFAVKTGEMELADDDVVLFTSDGIHDNLTKTQIAEIIHKYRDDGAQRISEELVKAANKVAAGYDIKDEDAKKKRPKHDDKTALVLMEEVPDMTAEAKIEE